jgi:hypothetical protein
MKKSAINIIIINFIGKTSLGGGHKVFCWSSGFNNFDEIL